MEYLTNLSWELWLALGLCLLAAEALGASGFLIGAAVAAIANSVLVWFVPDLSFTAQIVIYAVTAMVATAVYFRVFQVAQEDDGTPAINARAGSLVGTTLQLPEDLDGIGRVQIGDTMWKVTSTEPLAAGTEIVVVGNDGMTLEVAAR